MVQKNKELNNLKIKDLPKAIKKETLTPCFMNLIDNANENCLMLYNNRIKCSDDLFNLTSNEEELLLIIEKTKIPKNYIIGLMYLLKSFSFKSILIKKLEIFSMEDIEKLETKNIINTKTLLINGRTKEHREALSKELKITKNNLEKYIIAADLMRLKGVQVVKSKLFMAVGIKSLKMLGEQDPQIFGLILEEHVKKTKIVKAVPKPKEVLSDITWARLHPIIVNI